MDHLDLRGWLVTLSQDAEANPITCLRLRRRPDGVEALLDRMGWYAPQWVRVPENVQIDESVWSMDGC